MKEKEDEDKGNEIVEMLDVLMQGFAVMSHVSDRRSSSLALFGNVTWAHSSVHCQSFGAEIARVEINSLFQPV